MAVEQPKNKVDELWNKEAYFQLIEDCQARGGEEAKFLTLKIADLIKTVGGRKVLDVGCGEGAVVKDLSELVSAPVAFTGVDVAQVGVERARKKNISNAEFMVYDGQRIPFDGGQFDVTFSTFVFEHLTEPEAVFKEMTRVTKPGGHIAIACPNYGSPFFRSPCNKSGQLRLMATRLVQSVWPRHWFKQGFKWNPVTPIVLPDNAHIMDYDTTVEPNLLFFIKHLKNSQLFSLVAVDSGWNQFTYTGSNVWKKMFLNSVAALGRRGFPMFRYYGPFFFVVVQKV